jgi:hypothetical protein
VAAYGGGWREDTRLRVGVGREAVKAPTCAEYIKKRRQEQDGLNDFDLIETFTKI